jgi:3-keto-5-aminohexanoate cleavage enzyme
VQNAPLIVEAAINGTVTKAQNPHVPLTASEIAACVDACIAAGASIFHSHAQEPNIGKRNGRHSSALYIAALREIRQAHPSAILYPTLPGGDDRLTMADRYAHIAEIDDAGLLSVAPLDPGTINFGRPDADGIPRHSVLKQTSFDDVLYAFEFCRNRRLGCSLSIFEPGFLRLVLAHHRAGTLPQGSIVKFEFSDDWATYGLPSTDASLNAYLEMLNGTGIAWMVSLRGADVTTGAGLARSAIAKGGHVRVGIHDYAGPRTPRNEDLVAEIVALGRSLGRRPATPNETVGLLGLPSRTGAAT